MLFVQFEKRKKIVPFCDIFAFVHRKYVTVSKILSMETSAATLRFLWTYSAEEQYFENLYKTFAIQVEYIKV